MRERRTDRLTDRQTETETDRLTDRERHRQRDREKCVIKIGIYLSPLPPLIHDLPFGPIHPSFPSPPTSYSFSQSRLPFCNSFGTPAVFYSCCVCFGRAQWLYCRPLLFFPLFLYLPSSFLI